MDAMFAKNDSGGLVHLMKLFDTSSISSQKMPFFVLFSFCSFMKKFTSNHADHAKLKINRSSLL